MCKQWFSLLHGLSANNSVLRQISQLQETGVAKKDLRGKHTNRPHKISEELHQKVCDHIRSFPAQESHYSRNKNPTKRYLPEGLNVGRMYDLFLEKNQPEYHAYLREVEGSEIAAVKPLIVERTYRNIFDTAFNLGFGQPRSDTCVECDSLNINYSQQKAKNIKSSKNWMHTTEKLQKLQKHMQSFEMTKQRHHSHGMAKQGSLHLCLAQ